MSIRRDDITIDNLFDKFKSNLVKTLFNFLEQLSNYYQAYSSAVSAAKLKKSLLKEILQVESKYKDFNSSLSQFIPVIMRDSVAIKEKLNEIKLLKENYQSHENLLKVVPLNEHNDIKSESEQIKSQLKTLIPDHNDKISKLNHFKLRLKDGSIKYVSYLGDELFIIRMKKHIKDLKELIKNTKIIKEIENNYLAMKKALYEIQALSSYPDFMSLPSIDDLLTDPGSHHASPKTTKRTQHSTRTEHESDPLNPKRAKKLSQLDNDWIKLYSNNNNEQVPVQSDETSSKLEDQTRYFLNALYVEGLSKEHRNNRTNKKKKTLSTKFILNSIMPDSEPNLMGIKLDRDISKDYYETTLHDLEEKFKEVDTVDSYVINRENDYLCKEYHEVKKELDNAKKQLYRIKGQINHIEDLRKKSGDNSTDIQKSLNKEQDELKDIEHKINYFESKVKRIQKSIRKLDKKDYNLQNRKHTLYSGMQKLIEHWLLQVQKELDQETDDDRQVALYNDIEEAEGKLIRINADIDSMYLSYKQRKRNRMSTDFDYEHFCENSTFTECLERYDEPSEQ